MKVPKTICDYNSFNNDQRNGEDSYYESETTTVKVADIIHGGKEGLYGPTYLTHSLVLQLANDLARFYMSQGSHYARER